MRARLGCGLDDLQRAFERLVMVAGHFGDNQGGMVSAYQSVSNLEFFGHF